MVDWYSRMPPEEQRVVVVTLFAASAALWLAVAWEEVMVLSAIPLLAGLAGRDHPLDPQASRTAEGRDSVLSPGVRLRPVESPAAAADTWSMADPTWRPLGEILIERGLIDRVQLEHWLMQQKLSGMLLGELLVMHRVISPVDVAAALAVQRGAEDVVGGVTSGSRQLGRILVEQELLTESGLQRALLAQKRLGGNLGDILIERGYVSRQQIEEALADQNGRQHADPDPDPAERRGARGALRGARAVRRGAAARL